MKSVASVAMVALLLTSVLVSERARAADLADYRIGPGDVLSIMVWDNKDLDQKVFVRPDGKISLNLLGQVDVGGRTVAELAATLSEMYSKTVKDAQVVVDVLDIRSRAIYFVGGVMRPGPQQLIQDTTLLQAISSAGGLAQNANLGSATILRGNQVIPVDLNKLIQHADTAENIKIQPGDTIVIPVNGTVYVQGEVRSPGRIPYTKDLTIVKAIVQAGGFTTMAAPKRVILLRGTGTDTRTAMQVNVLELMESEKQIADMKLEPDDVITVPQRLF